MKKYGIQPGHVDFATFSILSAFKQPAISDSNRSILGAQFKHCKQEMKVLRQKALMGRESSYLQIWTQKHYIDGYLLPVFARPASILRN